MLDPQTSLSVDTMNYRKAEIQANWWDALTIESDKTQIAS